MERNQQHANHRQISRRQMLKALGIGGTLGALRLAGFSLTGVANAQATSGGAIARSQPGLSTLLSSDVPAPDWQARHTLSASEYQAELDRLTAQGFRPIDVNGYSVNGVTQYAGVWERSPGPAWFLRYGLTSDEHQALFSTLPSQGYRPVCVSGYEIGAGVVRYASLWYQTDGPAWVARHDLTAAELQAEYDALAPQGYRPIDVCGYTMRGHQRFTAIWEASPGEWVARQDLTLNDYQEQYQYWYQQGYRLARVSGYEVAGHAYYTAIWHKAPMNEWTQHFLSETEYQAAINDRLARGFRLVKVNGYPWNGQVYYAGIWHKPYLSNKEQAFIRETLTNVMNNYALPGASLALAYKGRLVLAQSYGYADRATQEPVRTDHLFRVASVSKPITAVAIFKLIEEGRLQLSDRVFGAGAILGTTYGVPKLDDGTPEGTPNDQITVQHLLEHTSGWAVTLADDPMLNQFDKSQAELIAGMVAEKKLQQPPGEIYSYLNFGYCLLGRVIEQVTGMAYADYVQQHVLGPLGITDMHIAGDTLAERRANEVVYYAQVDLDPNGIQYDPYGMRVSRMDAHGGWIASPTDLVRFMVAVDGFATKPDILAPDTIATMDTRTTAHWPDGSSVDYAKGWVANRYGNYWHDGSLPGTASLINRTHDEFCWAVVFNSRFQANRELQDFDIDNLLGRILNGITDWPESDLF